MTGPDVERAQLILRNHGYFVGDIDGVWGEISGRAASQAKYELGYRANTIRPSYGDTLEAYLTGTKRRTPAMVYRAKQRTKPSDLRRRMADNAQKYIGIKEHPPGSNRTRFSEWYGIIGPWCAMFVSYVGVESGSKAFIRGSRWAYCPFMLADATKQRHGLTKIDKSQADQGDIVLFSWKQDGVANHVGFVLTPVDANGNFFTCEGNTGADSSDGGQVQRRQRNTKDVIAFVRVVE